MTMAYIRETYGVPVIRGRRVEYTSGGDEVLQGVITQSHGAYLRVRVGKRVLRMHPTYGLRYWVGGEWVAPKKHNGEAK